MKKKTEKKTALEQMAGARRTSVVIPDDLWLKAKTRAAEEHTDLRTLILHGLVLRLQIPKDSVTLAKIHSIALGEDYHETIARVLREALDRMPLPVAGYVQAKKKRAK